MSLSEKVHETFFEDLAALDRDDWEAVKGCMDDAFRRSSSTLWAEVEADPRYLRHGLGAGALQEGIEDYLAVCKRLGQDAPTS